MDEVIGFIILIGLFMGAIIVLGMLFHLGWSLA